MQQLTTSVNFFKIRRVQSQEYRHRASLIFYYSNTIFIIIVINCQIAFKLEHQVLQSEQLVSILKFSETWLYLRGKCTHTNILVHLPSELFITSWAFMHEVNIWPSLSLARFFLPQQLFCQSKIKKCNVCLDIFVSDTSIARNFHFPGLEKLNFSFIRPHALFSDQISVFVLFKIKNV